MSPTRRTPRRAMPGFSAQPSPTSEGPPPERETDATTPGGPPSEQSEAEAESQASTAAAAQRPSSNGEISAPEGAAGGTGPAAEARDGESSHTAATSPESSEPAATGASEGAQPGGSTTAAGGQAAADAEALPSPPTRRRTARGRASAAAGAPTDADATEATETAATPSGRTHAGDGLVYKRREMHAYQLRVPAPLFDHYRRLVADLEDLGVETSINELILAELHAGPARAEQAIDSVRALRAHRESVLARATPSS